METRIRAIDARLAHDNDVHSGKRQFAHVVCLLHTVFGKLDGHDYAVSRSTAYDQVSLHQTDTNTIDGVRKKNGKEVATLRYQVVDANTLTMIVKPIGRKAQEEFVDRRGQSINSTDRVIGDWVMDASKGIEQQRTTLKYTADGPNGVRFEGWSFGYTATLDGKDSTSLHNSRNDSVAFRCWTPTLSKRRMN